MSSLDGEYSRESTNEIELKVHPLLISGLSVEAKEFIPGKQFSSPPSPDINSDPPDDRTLPCTNNSNRPNSNLNLENCSIDFENSPDSRASENERPEKLNPAN